MFHLGQNEHGPVYGAIIDIGSGSIGIGIVESSQENKLPTLLYTHRIPMRVSAEKIRDEEQIRRVQEAIISASMILSEEGGSALTKRNPKAKLSRLFTTCSSPWSYTVARNAHYEDAQTFTITKTLFDDLVKSTEAEIFSYVRSVPSMNSTFEVVERATVDVTVNDYPVNNPINLKGTTFGFSHIAGVVPIEIIKSINEVQDKLFPDSEMHTHTFMLVMYCVMRDLFSNMHSVCLIDVTGEATEFGIVENNLLCENSFIPYGSNTFSRDVMKQTGKPLADVHTFLSAFENDTVLQSIDIQASMQKYEEILQSAMQDIIDRRSLPSQIIITTPRAYEKIFRKMIGMVLDTLSKKKPQIISIEQKFIEEISKNADGDVYLALSARFFHKLHGCGEIIDK